MTEWVVVLEMDRTGRLVRIGIWDGEGRHVLCWWTPLIEWLGLRRAGDHRGFPDLECVIKLDEETFAEVVGIRGTGQVAGCDRGRSSRSHCRRAVLNVDWLRPFH